MAKSILVNAFVNGGNSTTAGTTEYQWLSGNLNKGTTEASREIIFRSAGTLGELYARVISNATTAASTIRTRKNGANGGQSQSIGIAATGEFEDTSGTDSVAAGDKLCIQTVTGAGGAINFREMSTMFDATTDTVSILAVTGPVSITTASTTWFMPIQGYNGNLLTVETFLKCRIRKSFTAKNMGVYVSAARAQATTVRSRKNAANGGQTVTCTASTTGWFEDTSGSDSLAAGDDFDYSVTTGTGADTLTLETVKCEYVSTAGDSLCFSGRGTGSAVADASTVYYPIGGTCDQTGTESATQIKAREPFDASNMQVMVSQNDIAATSTCDLRKNSTSTAVSVSITSSGTGIFTDTTNTVTLAASDEINYRLVATSVSGSHTITLTSIGIHFNLVTLTRISLSRIYKYNVNARVSLSRIYKYHVIGRISLSRIYKYHVLARISLSRIYKYHVLARISLSRIYKYHIIGRISLSRIYKYHVIGRISLARIYKYNILKKVSLSRIYKFHLLQRVGGKSLKFTAVDILHCGVQTSLWSKSKTKFSFSMWLRTDALSASFPLIALTTNWTISDGSFIIWRASTGEIGFSIWQGAEIFAQSTDIAASDLHSWHKITGTYDSTLGSANIKIYVDKKLGSTTGNATTTNNPNDELWLGSDSEGHEGNMKLFRFWSTVALTQTEVNNDYDNVGPTPDYELIMNEGTGNPVDSIGGKTTTRNNPAWDTTTSAPLADNPKRYRFNIIGRISLARIYKYNVAVRVSLSRIYKYHVVSRISLSRIYKYNMLARRSLSRIYKYHIQSRVSLSRIYKYHILGRISLGRIYKYNIAVRVSLSRIYKYHVAVRVSLVRIYKYNVAKRVSLSRIYKYNIAVRVSLSRIYKYHVLSRVSLARIYKYHVIARVSLARIYLWNVVVTGLTRISKPQIYKYNVAQRVSLARIYKYNVAVRISLSRIYKYHVLSRISLARIYKFNLLGRITLSRIYRYNMLGRISLQQSYKYHILQRLSKSQIYKWILLQRISLSNVLKWNVLSAILRISKSQIYRYNVVARISKQSTLKWNLASLAKTQIGKIIEWIRHEYSESDPAY